MYAYVALRMGLYVMMMMYIYPYVRVGLHGNMIAICNVAWIRQDQSKGIYN